MKRTACDSSDKAIMNCGCLILVLAFNFFVGGWSINYLLDFFLERTIPFIAAAFIGLIVGELSVPAAIVMVILEWCGIV